MTRILSLMMLSALASGPANLASIRSEPNLEKRAGLAMDYALKRVEVAREAWQAGRSAETTTALAELGDAAELTRESLKQTGKNASKSPKHFKKAELNARNLVRRLDGLINDMSVDEREPAERARERVRKVQEALLLEIMGGGRKR